MDTVATDERPASDVADSRHSPLSGVFPRLAGPTLIVGIVLFALRGFAFRDALTNQHPDILSFWLPHFCYLGDSLSSGDIPLWNPFQMGGMPYAADPQSGWLHAPAMALFTTLPCGGALRAFIVLQPILAGLGLYWFLRREELGRLAATAGGLSFAMLTGASVVAVSLPFAGMLAWTPYVLVGASGFFSTRRFAAQLGWLALAAFAWGQVAAAHMSHGMVMASVTVAVYVAARSIGNVRTGTVPAPHATLLAVAFLAFLPLANLALFFPRVSLLPRTSLRAGYAAVGGAVTHISGIERQPLAPGGIWSGWPLALGSAPGAYAGAAMLLSVPLALRAHGKRTIAWAFGAIGVVAYVLTLDVLVDASWFRSLILKLPWGDVYLHNPGRLRYLMLLVVPVIGAIGLHGLIERPPGVRRTLAWIGGGVGLWLLLPLVLGGHPVRFALLAAAIVVTVPVLVFVARGRRWAPVAVVGLLAAELMGSAAYSQTYQGGTVFTGLESRTTGEGLVPQPLRWPEVALSEYTASSSIVRAIRAEPGRYLTWAPPATYYEKGYLFTQEPRSWPALENGRGMLFGLSDALGYSPIQLTRYWSWIRAVNKEPVFYNAAVIQRPMTSDVHLLGIRYLIVPSVLDPPLPARAIASDRGFTLYEIDGWQPMASVVARSTLEVSNRQELGTIVRPEFDPAVPASGTVLSYREESPEDIRVTVEADRPSMLLVRNVFDPGWVAQIDGGPSQRVEPADYLIQGVPIPRGRHEVRLTYHDTKLGQGLVASAVVWGALALAAGAALLLEPRRRYSLNVGSGTGSDTRSG